MGLASGLAQVTLVARSAARGNIEAIGGPSERATEGSIREVSVPVRLSANTAYRLRVIRTDAEGSISAQGLLLWVQAESGEFRRLEPGSAVVVAGGDHAAQKRDLEVLYRLQAADSKCTAVPPVRYEIAISPQL